MSDIKDIFESLFKTLRERVTNPFLGTFTLSWLAINWKIVLLFFSSDYPTNIKIHFIMTEHLNICHGAIFPFITTIILILGMPYFYWLIEKGQGQAKLMRANEKNKFLGNRTQALEENAQATEDALIAKERQIKAELKLKDKSRYNQSFLKEVEIADTFTKGPILLNTDHNGATLTFPHYVGVVTFKSCVSDDLYEKSTYEIRNEDFAGEVIDRFGLDENRQLQEIEFYVEEELNVNKISIVKISGINGSSNIELFNILIEEKIPLEEKIPF